MPCDCCDQGPLGGESEIEEIEEIVVIHPRQGKYRISLCRTCQTTIRQLMEIEEDDLGAEPPTAEVD